jgi:hypothetical protein
MAFVSDPNTSQKQKHNKMTRSDHQNRIHNHHHNHTHLDSEHHQKNSCALQRVISHMQLRLTQAQGAPSHIRNNAFTSSCGHQNFMSCQYLQYEQCLFVS